MTNSDRIRSWSDRKLAAFIVQNRFCTVLPVADSLGMSLDNYITAATVAIEEWLGREESEETNAK